MDVDESGSIDRQEFRVGIESLNELFDPRLMTTEQINHLFDAVDLNKDGMISYEEFLSAFDITNEDEDDDEED